ncbi:MAG: NUDIX domain-containing protein [Actinomycetota bacterium]|nr:NUDIX domain-containing protein [Actinomycetota bacterium]
MKAVPDTLMRATYRVGYRVLHAYWRVAQPTKRGVKCVLTRDGQVLLVRHTYGPDTRWELPGGGVKRREDPQEAARREAREELGVDLTEWRFLGDLFERIDGKRDTLWCYAAELGDRRIETNAAEIAEAAWFDRGALPADSHRYVGRILARV